MAAEHGKHVIVEKPLALTLEDCDAIIEAVDRTGVKMIVGHTHSYDPAIGAMRRMIASGDYGKLGMINTWNYTNFLYRPAQAGGAGHVAGRRHPVQSGAAPGGQRAAAGRRAGEERAVGDRRLGPGEARRRAAT